MTQRPMIMRAVPLLDLEVAKDGRTVTAYAATFDDPYEVNDDEGHYVESIARTAFNRSIGRGIERIVPLFNHGLTVWGTPSERDSDPLGVALEIRPETRGLLTRTRYGMHTRAEEVLQMIKDQTVTSYSFRGTPLRSQRMGRTGAGLNLVQRTEINLKDYGPGVFTVNRNAEIVSVRSTTILAEEIEQLTPEERAELIAKLSPPPADPALDPENPDPQEHPADPASDPDPSTDHTFTAEAKAKYLHLLGD